MVQYSSAVDFTFSALSDPNRRRILERLARGDASISELAAEFPMTLTGVKKHVQVLERARLVTTEKVGRVRRCKLGSRRLDAEAAWIDAYRRTMEERYDALGKFLDNNDNPGSAT